MDTFIQCLPGFVASVVNDLHFQTTNGFDSSHPITFSYSSLSSSSHIQRHRITDWQHIRKHAYLVSSEYSVTAQQAQVENAVSLRARSMLQRPEQEETQAKLL